MQHLPVKKDSFAGRKYPDVPLKSNRLKYGSKHRGYQAFSNFPQECGYDLTRLKRADYDKAQFDDILTFLQDWLFSGLLIETFSPIGVCLNIEDFIGLERGSSTRLITTTRLPEYLFYWLAAVEDNRTHEKIQHGSTVQSCLSLHCQVLNAFSEYYCREVDVASLFADPHGLTLWGNERPPILLSLAVLGETIQYANHQINKIMDSRSHFLIWSFPNLNTLFKKAGWCPVTIETSTAYCNISYKLYLSMLSCPGRRNHTRCTRENGCVAYQVNEKNYTTQHTVDCIMTNHGRGYEFIGPQMQEITTILEEGDIPLIALDTTVEPNNLEVVRYQKNSEFNNDYVAISHVWSQGLGNARENKLSRCQLKRIQTLVNSMWEPPICIIPFWIDTLCVPLEKQARTLALKCMDRVYTEARAVLVLDDLLQHSVNSDAPVIELGVYLRHSAWMTRLWTYQEARLTQDLYLQFKDKPIHTDGLRRETHDFKLVSDILISKNNEEILAHPNMRRLARALAYDDPAVRASIQRYANLPQQDDSAGEEARQLAIQLTDDDDNKLAFLHAWRGRMQNEFLHSPPQSTDKDLRVSLSLLKCNTVPTQANRGLDKLKGIWDGPIETLRNVSDNPSYRAALQFSEIIRGCQARTTSRPEDEALCLAVLLGLNVTPIVQIPSLPRWTKNHLNRLRSLNLGLLNTWTHSLVDRKLKATHRQRMKALLSQIEFFPKQVAFWSTPRLSGLGWKWAPLSFMDEHLDVERSVGGERCRLTDAGLLITNTAIKLSNLRLCQRRTSQNPRKSNTLSTSLSLSSSAQPNYENDIFLYLTRHDQPQQQSSLSRHNITSWKSIRLRLHSKQHHSIVDQHLQPHALHRLRKSKQPDTLYILTGQNDSTSDTTGILVAETTHPSFYQDPRQRCSQKIDDDTTTPTITTSPQKSPSITNKVTYVHYLTTVSKITDPDSNVSTSLSLYEYKADASIHNNENWCIG